MPAPVVEEQLSQTFADVALQHPLTMSTVKTMEYDAAAIDVNAAVPGLRVQSDTVDTAQVTVGE